MLFFGGSPVGIAAPLFQEGARRTGFAGKNNVEV